MMKKNDSLQLSIEDLNSEGLGVAHADGMVLFVKDAIPGDVAQVCVTKVKKTYGYARVRQILSPSPDRVEAPCPVAGKCGGCQLQGMSYGAQLRFKEQKVRENLARIGKFADIPMEPILGMKQPLHYRNKAQFPIGTAKDGRIVAGFYARRTHAIVEHRDCLLGDAANKEILDIVIQFLEEWHIPAYDEATGQGLVRHVLIRTGFRTKQRMVCLVINGRELPHAETLVGRLCALLGMTSIYLNVNQERTNVILGGQCRLLWGKRYIEDAIGPVTYQISPLSFFQVNPAQTEKLYEIVASYAALTGEETVWDLYCGIGTIALFLARAAKQVYGVEVVPQAVGDARRNARRNGIANARFLLGKAEDILPEYDRRHAIQADVVVVDPPRKGCDAGLLQAILRVRPQKLIYVSCDSATLARDLRILCDGGYRLERVRAVDQFPMSVHVETVCLLRNR